MTRSPLVSVVRSTLGWPSEPVATVGAPESNGLAHVEHHPATPKAIIEPPTAVFGEKATEIESLESVPLTMVYHSKIWVVS